MFKHVKKTAVFVALVAVLASLFGASVSGWADGEGIASLQTRAGQYLEGSAIPPSPSRDNSVYEVPAPTSADEPINVTLIVEAGNLRRTTTTKFWVSNDVTLTSPASGNYTVTDLLAEVSATASYDLLFLDSGGAPITSQDSYVASLQHAGSTWTAGRLGYDGWEFRLNDKFPVFTDGTGWTGDSILQTNIVSGDVVHFFYDFPADYSPASGSFAANYVRGIRLSSDSTSLTVQLQGHTVYIHPTDYDMYVDNYKNVQAGVTAYLYDADAATLIDTKVSDANGRVVFSGTFASGGAYIVKTDPIYFPAFNTTTITADMLIALTGGFSKILVP